MTTHVYCRRVSIEDVVIYLEIFAERDESSATGKELIDAYLAAALKNRNAMVVISPMDVIFFNPSGYTRSVRDMAMSATKLFDAVITDPYDNIEHMCKHTKRGHMDLIMCMVNSWDYSVTSAVRDGVGYLLYVSGSEYGCLAAMQELSMEKNDFVILKGDVSKDF